MSLIFKHKFYPTLFLFVCVLMFYSCKKCDQIAEYTESNFTAAYPPIMPYVGNETLIFLKNNKDSIRFIGQGKQLFFNTVYRGGGDCEIKYNLLNHLLVFKNQNATDDITFWYYLYSETNNFQDYFEIDFGPMKVGPYMAGSQGSYFINLNVLGVNYPYVHPYKINSSDSIYITFSPLVNSMKRILRIKSQNNIYEILP